MPRMSDEQWTLSNLIDALEKRDQAGGVRFDFGGLRPTRLHSYRGYYEDLALGFAAYDAQGAVDTIGELLRGLKESVGCEFTGWKGGEFMMDRNTALWVANAGETSGTAIVGIHPEPHWTTIILTKWID